MKAAGWGIFLTGTLLAAATGAKLEPMWAPFAVGVVLAVVGAMILRRSQDAGGSVSEEEGGIKDLGKLELRFGELVGAVDAARALEGEAQKLALEAILLERLLPIVDARLLLAAEHGVEPYAEVFTPTASGERCLNRAWSMLVDGSGDAAEQVEAAHGHFVQALSAWPGRGEAAGA